MPDLGQRVAGIKARIDKAKEHNASAEHEALVAQAAVDHALKQLMDEFGVDTPQAADALLKELDSRAAAECARIEALLAKEGIA